jgi:hypothetical protein
MSVEALVMVVLAAAAVLVAFTTCKCPAASAEEHRIAWLPRSTEELGAEEEARELSLRR